NLGVAIQLQGGLGQVAQEVVGAVAVGHPRELPGDARDEGVLLVREPQPDRLAQGLGHLPRADQQPPDLVGAAGEQGLGEPDAAGVEFADGVEGLVALLRLQPVDAQPQRGHAPIGQTQQVEGLVAGGEHGLVAAQVEADGVFGQLDSVGVRQLAADLRHGPVACEATVTDEAEDVPADEPTGQGEGQFGGRAAGGRTRRAGGVGAVGEAAAKLQGTFQGADAMTASAADVQDTTAAVAVGLLHVKEPSLKDCALRPTETHWPLLPASWGQDLLYASSV